MEVDSKKMRRASDSFLTSIFARSISCRITPILAKTRITPLQMTLAGLLLGLLAACQAGKNGWPNHLSAVLLLELSHVFDCIDGELARVTNRGNAFAAALDPITDRIKDIFLMYAAFVQSVNHSIFGLSDSILFGISFFAIGSWMLYMYIVDAYLNPARKKRLAGVKKYYVGLYDFFIYGTIAFLATGLFEYFILYIISLSFLGNSIQLYRLRSFLK